MRSLTLPPPSVAAEANLFYIGDVEIAEPSDASRPLLIRVPVTVYQPARVALSFGWHVSGGTATPGADYIDREGTLTIGERSETQRVGYIPIKILDDDELEEDETIEIEIFPWDDSLLMPMKRFATITIHDDLDLSGVEQTERGLVAGVVSGIEGFSGASNVYVPVIIDRPLDRDVRFTWNMVPGFSSADPSDIRVTSGRGIIRAGQTVGGFIVAIRADSLIESPESVALNVIPDDPNVVNWGGFGILKIFDVVPT